MKSKQIFNAIKRIGIVLTITAVVVFVTSCSELPNVEYCSYLAAIATFFVTVAIAVITSGIQKHQYKNQLWIDLIAKYRSTEFGIAVKDIVDFWIDGCNRDFGQIYTKYYDLYSGQVKNHGCTVSESIHFKRRMLSQFYQELNEYIKEEQPKKKELCKYFNLNEMNLFMIIYHMNRASEQADIYRPVKADAFQDTENTCDFLKELYSYFKETLDSCGNHSNQYYPETCFDLEKKTKENLIMFKLIYYIGNYSNINNIVHVEQKCIAEKAFWNERNVEAIVFIDTNLIEKNAFENCKNLKVVSWEEIGSDNQTDEKVFVVEDSTSNVEKKEDSSESEKNKLVINESAFLNCSELETVIFPKVEKITIEKHAFAGCNSLRTLDLRGCDEVVIADDAIINKENVTIVTDGCNSSAAKFAIQKEIRHVSK